MVADPQFLSQNVPWPSAWQTDIQFGLPLAWWLPTFPIWSIAGGLLHAGLSWPVVERLIWLFPLYICLVLSPYVLALRLTASTPAAMAAAAVFSLNTWVVDLITRGHVSSLVAYALLPFAVLLGIDVLRHRNLKDAFLLGIITWLQVSFDIRYAYLTALIVAIFLGLSVLRERKVFFDRRLLAVSIVFIVTCIVANAYWLLPGTVSPVHLPSGYGAVQSFIDASRNLTLRNAVVGYYPFFEHLYSTDAFVGKLPPVYFYVWPCLIALVAWQHRASRFIVPFLIIWLIAVMLAAGPTSVVGFVSITFFKLFPGGRLFRDISKMYSLVLFSESILLAFLVMASANWLMRVRGWTESRAALSIAGALFFLNLALMGSAFDPLRLSNYAPSVATGPEQVVLNWIERNAAGHRVLFFPDMPPYMDPSPHLPVVLGGQMTAQFAPLGVASLNPDPANLYRFYEMPYARSFLCATDVRYIAVIDDPYHIYYEPWQFQIDHGTSLHFFRKLPWLREIRLAGSPSDDTTVVFKIADCSSEPAWAFNSATLFLGDSRALANASSNMRLDPTRRLLVIADDLRVPNVEGVFGDVIIGPDRYGARPYPLDDTKMRALLSHIYSTVPSNEASQATYTASDGNLAEPLHTLSDRSDVVLNVPVRGLYRLAVSTKEGDAALPQIVRPAQQSPSRLHELSHPNVTWLPPQGADLRGAIIRSNPSVEQAMPGRAIVSGDRITMTAEADGRFFLGSYLRTVMPLRSSVPLSSHPSVYLWYSNPFSPLLLRVDLVLKDTFGHYLLLPYYPSTDQNNWSIDVNDVAARAMLERRESMLPESRDRFWNATHASPDPTGLELTAVWIDLVKPNGVVSHAGDAVIKLVELRTANGKGFDGTPYEDRTPYEAVASVPIQPEIRSNSWNVSDFLSTDYLRFEARAHNAPIAEDDIEAGEDIDVRTADRRDHAGQVLKSSRDQLYLKYTANGTSQTEGIRWSNVAAWSITHQRTGFSVHLPLDIALSDKTLELSAGAAGAEAPQWSLDVQSGDGTVQKIHVGSANAPNGFSWREPITVSEPSQTFDLTGLTSDETEASGFAGERLWVDLRSLALSLGRDEPRARLLGIDVAWTFDGKVQDGTAVEGMIRYPKLLEPTLDPRFSSPKLSVDHLAIPSSRCRRITFERLECSPVLLNSGTHVVTIVENGGRVSPTINIVPIREHTPPRPAVLATRQINASELVLSGIGARRFVQVPMAYDDAWRLAVPPKSFRPTGIVFLDYLRLHNFFVTDRNHYQAWGNMNAWRDFGSTNEVILIYVRSAFCEAGAAMSILGLLTLAFIFWVFPGIFRNPSRFLTGS